MLKCFYGKSEYLSYIVEKICSICLTVKILKMCLWGIVTKNVPINFFKHIFVIKTF